MKDHNMTKDPQEFFDAGKDTLDKCIAKVGRLAEGSAEISLACCAAFELDQRDEWMTVSAHLTDALASLRHARAAAGKINGGGVTRSGGT